jgi:quercetin dioxygenase-like cupin family protein
MRLKRFLALGALAIVSAGGAALASHPQIDPTTVPTGFLAAHNRVTGIRVSAVARAVSSSGTADVFVQHVRLGENEATGWHTHPGPVFVTVVDGSLTYEDAGHNRCRQRTYTSGEGFVDPGFGHVHRAIAGDSGVHFYAVYILPVGSLTHVIGADAPEECAS